jgi:type IV pilus assembly protein PilB
MAENSDEADTRAKARMHGLEYVPPRLIQTRDELASLLPESVARACHVLPQPLSEASLKILISDPLDFEAIDQVRFAADRPVDLALASRRAIQESIDRIYRMSEDN